MIKIQKEDFIIETEIEKIKLCHEDVGALSMFVGYVRNTNKNKQVNSIKLEVYEEMAIKSLKTICSKALKKWSLIDCLIIHRYGHLSINEKIVLVATFSKHRKHSFESCNYIMNYLKKDVPIWKKEIYNNESKWLQNLN